MDDPAKGEARNVSEGALPPSPQVPLRAGGAAGSGATGVSSKAVCALVDGSSNSFAALRWALEHLLDAQDDLYLLTVEPFEDFTTSAERTLQEACEFARNAGVKEARLHQRNVAAAASSRTRGVGEAIRQFVEQNKADVLVLGGRGMGAVESAALGSLGMGSVSEFCVQRLQCPMLVVKQQADE